MRSACSRIFCQTQSFKRSRSGTIVAWASPRDQELIQQTLDEMRVENSAEKKLHMQIYPLNTENAAQVVTFVQSLVPTARVTLDPDTQNLAVWGTKKDQEIVRDAVTKITSGGASGGPGGARNGATNRSLRPDKGRPDIDHDALEEPGSPGKVVVRTRRRGG